MPDDEAKIFARYYEHLAAAYRNIVGREPTQADLLEAVVAGVRPVHYRQPAAAEVVVGDGADVERFSLELDAAGNVTQAAYDAVQPQVREAVDRRRAGTHGRIEIVGGGDLRKLGLTVRRVWPDATE